MEKKEKQVEKKPCGFYCIHSKDANLAIIPVMDNCDVAPMACSIAEILPKLWQICSSLKELTLTFTPESVDGSEVESKDIITFNR